MRTPHHALGAAVLSAALLLGLPATAEAAAPKATPQLSIALDNGHTALKGGEALRYAITVTNLGTSTVKDLTVTQTLPVGATDVSADADGKRSGATVAWKVKVKAAAKTTVHVRLRAPKRSPEGLLRLASVACAQVEPKGPPMVCASDSDLLPAGAAAQAATRQTASAGSFLSELKLPWVAGGAGLVAAGLLTVVLVRRRSA